ncbi:MAG: hypothetical protein IH984_10315 [Planctomycetes bacterium]|nr:hypothetical protein [Planctomycetota bacterium]
MGLLSRRILQWQVDLYLNGVDASAYLNIPRFSELKVTLRGIVRSLEESPNRDEEREVGIAIIALQKKLSLARIDGDPLLSKCISAIRNREAIQELARSGKLNRFDCTNSLVRSLGLEGTMIGVDPSDLCAVDTWADFQIC